MRTNSEFEMPPAARRTTVLALAAGLVTAGCGGLTPSPGADFGVSILGRQPLAIVGLVTAPLRFDVTGCAAFDASVQSGRVVHAIDSARQPDGTFLAAVPVEWLRVEDHSCLDDAMHQLRGTASLVVTCRDAGRSASADLEISYGTATRARALYWTTIAPGPAQYLFESSDPMAPYVLWPAPYGELAVLFPDQLFLGFWLDTMLQDPLAQPRVVASGAALFASSACRPSEPCPDVAVEADVSAPGQVVRAYPMDASGHPNRLGGWASVQVPATVLDMDVLADGTLVVLSELDDRGFYPVAPAASVVTRVVATVDATGTRVTLDAAVIGYFPAESARSRLARTRDGRLAFLAIAGPPASGPLRSVLHATDGQTVSSTLDPTGGLDLGRVVHSGGGSVALTYHDVQLAPDASAILVAGYPAPVLGTIGSAFSTLPVTNAYGLDGERDGAVWLTDAIALWRSTDFQQDDGTVAPGGGVEVFDAAPPHARRYGYGITSVTRGENQARLVGVAAVGDTVVLTTSTGVRALDRSGALIAGSDPLPCGLSPSGPSIRTAATSFATASFASATSAYLFVFDLAATAGHPGEVVQTGTTSSLRAVWGAATDDLWAVGDGTMLRWNGASWSDWEPSDRSAVTLYGLWGSSSRDVWAVGLDATIVHFDGGEWRSSAVPAGTTASLRDVWGSGPGDVWAVGEAGTALHWDGRAWSTTTVPAGTGALHGVWGSGPSDVWAVGERGVVLRWDGGAWAGVAVPGSIPGALNRIWGSSPDDVWAVGESGAALHWSGGRWAVLRLDSTELGPSLTPSSPHPGALHGLWGSGPDDVWAVGDYATILHWNGSGWSRHAVPAGIYLWFGGVWRGGTGDVWAVGANGTAVRLVREP